MCEASLHTSDSDKQFGTHARDDLSEQRQLGRNIDTVPYSESRTPRLWRSFAPWRTFSGSSAAQSLWCRDHAAIRAEWPARVGQVERVLRRRRGNPCHSSALEKTTASPVRSLLHSADPHLCWRWRVSSEITAVSRPIWASAPVLTMQPSDSKGEGRAPSGKLSRGTRCERRARGKLAAWAIYPLVQKASAPNKHTKTPGTPR